jgi:23S rRNA (adenine2503-C2)-methyltransferase
MYKTDMASMTPGEIEAVMEKLGEKRFRSAQIFHGIHKGLAESFAEISTLPPALAAKLDEGFYIPARGIHTVLRSKLDDTTKYLIKLTDGNIIETVSMSYTHGNTVCISSQAGCRMGCAFCASKPEGFGRNLLAAEMLGQVYAVMKDRRQNVSNIVVMGTGEPLDNFGNLLRFLELARDPNGLGISHRNITVSTCGLIKKIAELKRLRLQITLALSLHAPNDELRRRLMPIAKVTPVRDITAAMKDYADFTGRRVSYEYALIKDTNDGMAHARELAALLRRSLAHVNLIPVNEVAGSGFTRGSDKRAREFAAELEKAGIAVSIRRELGADISAACGQLRSGIQFPVSSI